MDKDLVVCSQCAACQEQRFFPEPEECARCLSGFEEAEKEEDEKRQAFLKKAA